MEKKIVYNWSIFVLFNQENPGQPWTIVFITYTLQCYTIIMTKESLLTLCGLEKGSHFPGKEAFSHWPNFGIFVFYFLLFSHLSLQYFPMF